jgi:hypothetical protein
MNLNIIINLFLDIFSFLFFENIRNEYKKYDLKNHNNSIIIKNDFDYVRLSGNIISSGIRVFETQRINLQRLERENNLIRIQRDLFLNEIYWFLINRHFSVEEVNDYIFILYERANNILN